MMNQTKKSNFMKIISKRIIVLAVFIMVNLSAFSQSADLTNGWKLSPLGRRISLGDLPIHMVIDPTGKYAVVSNAEIGRAHV